MRHVILQVPIWSYPGDVLLAVGISWVLPPIEAFYGSSPIACCSERHSCNLCGDVTTSGDFEPPEIIIFLTIFKACNVDSLSKKNWTADIGKVFEVFWSRLAVFFPSWAPLTDIVAMGFKKKKSHKPRASHAMINFLRQETRYIMIYLVHSCTPKNLEQIEFVRILLGLYPNQGSLQLWNSWCQAGVGGEHRFVESSAKKHRKSSWRNMW